MVFCCHRCLFEVNEKWKLLIKLLNITVKRYEMNKRVSYLQKFIEINPLHEFVLKPTKCKKFFLENVSKNSTQVQNYTSFASLNLARSKNDRIFHSIHIVKSMCLSTVVSLPFISHWLLSWIALQIVNTVFFPFFILYCSVYV